jgi:mono/diheme cytochrome c family protein
MRKAQRAKLKVVGVVFCLVEVSAALAAPNALSPQQRTFFENKVRPILAQHCYKCHSSESTKVQGGLLLDTKPGWEKGGASGPVISPGQPEDSRLIKAVRYTDPELQMPPKGEKLSDQQVADLVAWVKMGAPDPRDAAGATSKTQKADARSHWSFQPVQRPTPPAVKDPRWAEHPVDAFIAAKLEQNQLKPSAPAERRTLLRRVYFDLLGLPPTPEEVQRFLEDSSPDAFRRVVDDLLARPQYGERWGRHWLDVARYSDSKGEIKRQRDTPLYAFAWTYRDYVIRSFNEDKPYDRFVLEQIAADRLLPSQENAALAALGFLTLGERFGNNENDIINDRIDVVTKGLLGLTVSCARCHDHMFDPIPTQDYYSLRGIFASTHEPKLLPLIGGDPTVHPDYADYYSQRTNLQYQLDGLFANVRPRERNPQQRRELLRQKVELENRISALELTHPAAPARAHVLLDNESPKDSPVFIRGEADNKGRTVPRRFLQCLSGPNRKPFTQGSGRLELAQAISSKSNPLTARVMVNRIWQHHFGKGIVSTVDDFGSMGASPTHPELLDYLATYLVEHDWSIKEMHRLILSSRTYQQTSDTNPRQAQLDPFNQWLSRQNLRRLELEPLRDSFLAFGGKLDTNLYGKPVPMAAAKGRNFRATLVLEPSHRPQDIGYTTRRTIYGYIDRADLPEVFNHFDFANPDMSSGQRYQTTVPQQALYVMNSPLVVEQARNLVERPDVQACTTPEQRIRRLYEIVYQRPPRPEEVQLGLDFVTRAETPEDESPTAAAAEPFAKGGRGLGQGSALSPSKGPFGEQARKRREAMMTARKSGARNLAPLSAWAEYAHALLLANEASFVN